MSKVFALSGLRVAYLVAPPALAAGLRAITPPWPVNLAGQKAAIEALHETGYYERRWTETHALRKQLAEDLTTRCGLQVVESAANFVLTRLPTEAGQVVARCQSDGVYLRDVSTLAAGFDGHHIRVSVRTAAENAAVVESLAAALRPAS